MTGGQLSAGAAGGTLAEQCPGSELSQHQGQDERTWTGQGDHQRNPQRHLRRGAWTPLELAGEGHSQSFQGMGTACHPGCPQSTAFKVRSPGVTVREPEPR